MFHHLPPSLRASTVAAALLLAGGAGAQTLPVANAGPDQTISCAPATGASVTLDGTGSFDPDNPQAVLTFTWSGDALGAGVTVDGATPTVTLPVGTSTLTLTVDDGVDGTATDTVDITVIADTVPPTLTLGSDSVELWPPNHKLHALNAADFATASDDCTDPGPTILFVSGTSDEADDGSGDGHSTGDLSFAAGCATAMVRAERAGNGDGRVYQLTLEAQDAAGNVSAPQVVTVSVPHDRAHAAVDSGDAFTVTADQCGPVEMCPPAPSGSCADAGTASVEMKRSKNGASLRWRARGFAATDGEFSDPSADYQLCVYTDNGSTSALADDPAAPHGQGWKHKGGHASFRSRGGSAFARLDGVSLHEKKGQGSLSVSAGGSDVKLPPLPLAQGTALSLQLRDSSGQCVSSTFEDPEVNDSDHLEDQTGK